MCIALESKTPVTSQFPLMSQTEFINMVHQRSFCVNIVGVLWWMLFSSICFLVFDFFSVFMICFGDYDTGTFGTIILCWFILNNFNF